MAVYSPDPELSAEDFLDDLGAILTARYIDAENELLRQAAAKAYRILELEQVAEYPGDALTRQRALQTLAIERATTLRDLRATAQRIVNELREQDLARALLAEAAANGEAAAAKRLGMARRLPATTTLTGSASSAVAQLALDLSSRMEVLHSRILRYPQDVYQRIISETAPRVMLGATTSTLAQREAVRRFVAEGVTGFVDRAGRKWRIGTYAEMATRTAVQRAWQDAGIARMQKSGVNLVTIVRGNDACDKCAPWSGRILSTDGTTGTITVQHATQAGVITVEVAATLEQARDAGWNHPNCRCAAVAYLPGLSLPADVTTWDPQAAKDRDRQRLLERRIRASKRDVDTAPDALSRQRAKREVAADQRKLKEHLAATGRKRDSRREQLSFTDP